MGSWHKSYTDVMKNVAHYVALGNTTVHLDEDDPSLPWSEVLRVESSNGVRLNGPTGFYCIVEKAGLELKWSVDFETRDANGRGYSSFDRDRLRAIMMRLPEKARAALAVFLEREVMPAIEKNTAEWREMLNKQTDSEDCVRGLIAFARQKSAA